MKDAAGAERPSRGHELLLVQLVFVSFAGAATLVRAYVKVFLVGRVTSDDYLIFAAMGAYAAYAAVAIDGVVNGATGQDVSQQYTPNQAAKSLLGWYLCEAMYAPITLAIRASVCIVLLRITTKKAYRIIIWINVGVIAVVSIVFAFVMAFQCSPPSYFWKQVFGAEGSCIDKRIVMISVYVHSVFSAVSDWCLGLLPIAILWGVQINMRTKVIVAFLLSLGMVAGVVLIVRMPYVTKLQPSLEFLYVSIDVAIWSVMEPALGIIAACVATYRPLFKTWGFGWGSTRRSAATTSHGYGRSQRRTGHWELHSQTDLNRQPVPGHRTAYTESVISGEAASPGAKTGKTTEVTVTSEPVATPHDSRKVFHERNWR